MTDNIQRWTVTLEEDPVTHELIMPFPPDLLSQMGWDNGDTLLWEDMHDGSFALKKADPQPEDPTETS